MDKIRKEMIRAKTPASLQAKDKTYKSCDSTIPFLVVSGMHIWAIKPMFYLAVPFVELFGGCPPNGSMEFIAMWMWHGKLPRPKES